MSRRFLPLFAIVLAAACTEPNLPSISDPVVTASSPSAPRVARERLAERLARALADPAVRASLKQRLDASRAPERKLQFQALARADQAVLLAALTRSIPGSVQDVLADLNAAHGLEVYLPVAAHRAEWSGDDDFLVATIGRDGDSPIAFDAAGTRYVLHPDRAPDTPVLALVPQETDFTGGRPQLAATCWDWCGGGYGGASPGGYTPPANPNAGLYLTSSHFEEGHESWLKGKPEYEYHVYGLSAGSDAEQLACTGEHAGGGYVFDQNDDDWNGSALMLSETDRAAYERSHPGQPVRIVAFEDDDGPCEARVDGNRLTVLLQSVDAAYRAYTSGKLEPLLFRGIKAAPSVFNLVSAVRNAITTGDDIIGNAVESSISGWVPGGANWALKTDGTRTAGWFTTEYRR